MSQTARNIIGAIAMLVLIALYALLATAFAAANLGESSTWVHLAYFFFTGILWIVPAMFIIKWMVGSPKT